MKNTRSIRAWSFVHTWSSLICTVFLLMLCITGLPLIFHHEIDHLLGNEVELPVVAPGTQAADLDRVIAAGVAHRPGEVVQYMIWDQDEPERIWLSMAPTPTSPLSDLKGVVIDGRTASLLDEPKPGFIYVMFKLHVDMFAGLPGKLFLGFMGFLFVVALVSGVVLYAPFMRKLEFGTVRQQKSRRTRWLDLHNLLGIVTLVWMLVVGATGVINTWADLVVTLWRHDQLAEMVAPYRDQPPVTAPGSLERAVATARAAAPGMTPAFVAFPQSLYSSGHHYAVFMRGASPLTSRVYTPALIDATTGELTAIRSMPWYAVSLFVSQPLHFGDYGGLPLRIIWAVLDIIAIIVLGSGVYLWVVRKRRPVRKLVHA